MQMSILIDFSFSKNHAVSHRYHDGIISYTRYTDPYLRQICWGMRNGPKVMAPKLRRANPPSRQTRAELSCFKRSTSRVSRCQCWYDIYIIIYRNCPWKFKMLDVVHVCLICMLYMFHDFPKPNWGSSHCAESLFQWSYPNVHETSKKYRKHTENLKNQVFYYDFLWSTNISA